MKVDVPFLGISPKSGGLDVIVHPVTNPVYCRDVLVAEVNKLGVGRSYAELVCCGVRRVPHVQPEKPSNFLGVFVSNFVMTLMPSLRALQSKLRFHLLSFEFFLM